MKQLEHDLYLYICTDGEEVSTSHQESYMKTRDTPMPFKLACDIEKQLQVADSFKLEFPNYPTSELNELSTEELSGDEVELNVKR